MLDAAELIELAVFERHCLNLESKHRDDDTPIIDYFKTRISDLKERSKDN